MSQQPDDDDFLDWDASTDTGGAASLHPFAAPEKPRMREYAATDDTVETVPYEPDGPA